MEPPKRLCPFCGGADISPDAQFGSIPGYRCRSCNRNFPSPIEFSKE